MAFILPWYFSDPIPNGGDLLTRELKFAKHSAMRVSEPTNGGLSLNVQTDSSVGPALPSSPPQRMKCAVSHATLAVTVDVRAALGSQIVRTFAVLQLSRGSSNLVRIISFSSAPTALTGIGARI
jgi:hypothetical protein